MLTTIGLSPAHKSQHQALFNSFLINSELRISVVIPVKNEAHHLKNALQALRNQLRLDGSAMPKREYEVLVLLNNCTDESETVVRLFRQQYPDFSLQAASLQLPPEKANVGTARRLLMDEASYRLSLVGRSNGIIASTDGDTVVDQYWIAQIRAEIERGCDAVGGRILTQPNSNPVRLNHLRNVTYRMLIARLESILDPIPFDPWPRHFQHFGASLALTNAMYERVGGLPEVTHLEDEALYRALLRIDARVRRSPYVSVTTSSRMQGRVAVGFSEQLRYWESLNQTHQSQLVESLKIVIQRIQIRHTFRTYWQTRDAKHHADDLARLATDLQADTLWLKDQLDQSRYFGQLWERIQDHLDTQFGASGCQFIPITEAIAELRSYLRTWQSRFRST